MQQPTTDRPKMKMRKRNLAILVVVAAFAAVVLTWRNRHAIRSLLVDAGLVSSAKAIALKVPPGFQADVFASGLSGPRFMTFGPDGNLYVAERGIGRVIALPKDPATGTSARSVTVADGLQSPNSVAFARNVLYVGEVSSVTRMTVGGNMRGTNQERIITDLPGEGDHVTRTVLVGPEGKLYVSIGSSCNVCDEADSHRAAVWVYGPDGRDAHLYARGLRNAVGMAVNPLTQEIWVTNNGRDLMGDDIPPDNIYVLHEGKNYGWPRCHAGAIIDPDFGAPGDCDGVEQPLLNLQAHSAPLGMTFSTESRFPARHPGLFVAFHGSWNRSSPTGYKVVFIPLDETGKVIGSPQDFATGWLQGGSMSGRPAGLAVGPDGALYVSDDVAGFIYRISRSQ